MDRIPMSREGYEKLKRELDELDEQMPAIVAEISRTRAFGDISENAEYHAAREAQGHLQAKIAQKRSQLAHAYIVDESKLPRDEVVFNAKVRVKDLDLEEEEVFHFVGQGQEDYDSNRIAITSPIGQGLLGKKVGEVAEIAVPQGTIRFEVLEITFD